ncbi:hypothetical protein L7F22_043421 [Adiantum nelumboides]|nr:hypothetical protein [Adiantum nelumboides]
MDYMKRDAVPVVGEDKARDMSIRGSWGFATFIRKRMFQSNILQNYQLFQSNILQSYQKFANVYKLKHTSMFQTMALACKRVLKLKVTLNDAKPKYKARLVAKGCRQEKNVDFDEIFLPVVKMDTFCLVLALVFREDMELVQYEGMSVFLHGDLHEDIKMQQREGVVAKGKEHLVCAIAVRRTTCFTPFRHHGVFMLHLFQVAACFDHRVNFFSKITVRAGDTISRSEVEANTEVRREKSSSSASVHPTAIVHQGAIIQEDVVIGPFCTVGPAVKLGKGCLLHANSHVLGESEIGEGCILHAGAIVGADVPGRTTLGKQNVIGHYAVVGIRCQDLKYKEGDGCHLHIGNKNDIREFVSIHRSSSSSDQTTIGNSNLIMGTCHVAHDCKLGDGNILANGTLLGGHVILQDYVHTGGGVAVHQRCQIDSYAFVAGGSMVVRDVPMYVMVSGDRAQIRGLNVEGLRRHNFGDNEMRKIKKAYQRLFMSSDRKLEDRLANLELIEDMMSTPAIFRMINSVKGCLQEDRRGICEFGRWKSVVE